MDEPRSVRSALKFVKEKYGFEQPWFRAIFQQLYESGFKAGRREIKSQTKTDPSQYTLDLE